MALSFGLIRMEKDDVLSEGLLKDLNELGSEGNFGDEEDDGFLSLHRFFSKSKVNIGFAATGDTKEEFCGGFSVFNAV